MPCSRLSDKNKGVSYYQVFGIWQLHATSGFLSALPSSGYWQHLVLWYKVAAAAPSFTSSHTTIQGRRGREQTSLSPLETLFLRKICLKQESSEQLKSQVLELLQRLWLLWVWDRTQNCIANKVTGMLRSWPQRELVVAWNGVMSYPGLNFSPWEDKAEIRIKVLLLYLGDVSPGWCGWGREGRMQSNEIRCITYRLLLANKLLRDTVGHLVGVLSWHETFLEGLKGGNLESGRRRQFSAQLPSIFCFLFFNIYLWGTNISTVPDRINQSFSKPDLMSRTVVFI